MNLYYIKRTIEEKWKTIVAIILVILVVILIIHAKRKNKAKEEPFVIVDGGSWRGESEGASEEGEGQEYLEVEPELDANGNEIRYTGIHYSK